MPVKKLFYVLVFFCQILIFIFLLAFSFDKIGSISQNKLSDAYLILFRFALSLYKIGCALELATLKTLFSICLFAQLALSLHFIMP